MNMKRGVAEKKTIRTRNKKGKMSRKREGRRRKRNRRQEGKIDKKMQEEMDIDGEEVEEGKRS